MDFCRKDKRMSKGLWLPILLLCCLLAGGCGAAVRQDATDNGKVQDSSKTADNVETVAYDMKIAAMKGPTAIGMVKMIEDNKSDAAINHYEFTIAGTADEFTAQLVKGDIQIAAIPCNLAANLYNKSEGKIQVLAVNTLGVLYFVENGDSINSVADLKGKTIYATGKGTTPEYTLRYLLKKAGIDPDKEVNIEFKSEAAEVAAILNAGAQKDIVAMLPQPYVTSVMMNNEKIRIALDVTEEWEKLTGGNSTVVTGVVVVNTQYAKENPEAVASFVKDYRASVEFVNSNVDEAAKLVESAGIFKEAVASAAIPYCNITFISGDEMKEKVNAYLRVLFDENPASIGGAMPAGDFWYLSR